MPSLLGGIVRARLGHVTGQMQGQQMQEQQQAAQEKKDADRARQVLEMQLLERKVNEPVVAPAPRNIDALSPQGIDAAVDRERRLVAVRPKAGEAAGQPPKLTEGERRGGALLTMAESAYPLLESATAPSRPASIAAKLGMNEALSAERQKIEQAASTLVSSYLYLVSGATATDDEIKRRAQEVIPQAGDGPEVIAQKKQSRAAMMEAMRVAAGKAAGVVNAKAPTTRPFADIEDAYEEALSGGMPPAKADQLRQQAIARRKTGGP